MTFNFFDKLSENLINLRNDKECYDVIFKVEDEKSFTAHSNILKYRSSYFRNELNFILPNENNTKTILKPKVSSQIFEIILQ